MVMIKTPLSIVLDENRGMPNDSFDGRPIIGICNTFSELTPCNAHFRGLAEKIKAALQAGILEFP